MSTAKKIDSVSQISVLEIVERKNEEVADFIEEYAKGLNKDLVREYGKNLVHNIESVDLNVRSNVSDTACGKMISENIKKLLEFGGESLTKVVEYNIDIGKLNLLRCEGIKNLKMNLEAIEEEIYLCEKYDEPKRDEYDFSASVEIETLREEMNIEYEYNDNFGQDEVEGVKTRSKKSAEAKTGGESQKVNNEEESKIYEFNMKCRSIKLQWNKRFLEDKKDYKVQNGHLKDLRRQKDVLNAKINSESVVQQIMRGIEMGLLSICNKIKNAVKERHKLRELLQSRIIFDSTGEIVANPYDKGNVPGMIGIIQKKFHTASFGSFTNELVDVMRLTYPVNLTNTDPIKIGQAVDKIMGNWDSMNYWEYMTRDVFFTAILLRSLAPESDVTTRAIFEVNSYIGLREKGMKSGEISNDEDEKSTPIYQHLMDYLATISDTMDMKRSSSKRIERDESHQQNDSNSQRNYQKPHEKPYKNYGNTESAASANASSNDTKNSENKRVDAPIFDTMFKDLVTREMNVTTVAKNGYRLQYTSTRAECQLCIDPQNSSHKPRCYLGKCKKCNNYGHKADCCRQLPTSFTKEKVQANMANDIGKKCDQEQA
jgi:hypothetical protein